MQFDAILFPPRRAAMIAQGFWRDRTINDDLDACLQHRPDKEALTAVSIERGETRRLTYRELARLADRLAVGLQDRHVAGVEGRAGHEAKDAHGA